MAGVVRVDHSGSFICPGIFGDSRHNRSVLVELPAVFRSGHLEIYSSEVGSLSQPAAYAALKLDVPHRVFGILCQEINHAGDGDGHNHEDRPIKFRTRRVGNRAVLG